MSTAKHYLDVIFNVMRYINSRFTYFVTYLLVYRYAYQKSENSQNLFVKAYAERLGLFFFRRGNTKAVQCTYSIASIA